MLIMNINTKKILNLNKTIVTLVLLNTVQIGAAAGVIFYDYISKKNFGIAKGSYGAALILVILIAIVINGFLSVRDARIMIKSRSQYDMVKSSLEQVESLNNKLRGQRHDFMNHLQIVYSLMEMEEYRDAQDYIEKVFHDIQKVSSILKTANPAVNALLQAKLLFCEKRNIKIEFNITSRLDNLKIPSWEFCRVIGNLIDNSIYALQEIQEDKNINLHIYEDLRNHCFKIRNNGPAIPENILSKIFEPGFTTKGEHGDGMGLAITREILETYGGSITVTSDKTETLFEGFIPK